MSQEKGWLHILTVCKDNVQERIAPVLKTLSQHQPDLGVGAGGDAISTVDLTAERAIVETLRKHDISFTLISEESGVKEYGEDPHRCFVTTDPIDGTTNLMRGLPFYATSIAIGAEPSLSTVRAALVADLFHGITYTAQKGHGSFRNDQRLTPSSETSLDEAVIGMDLNSYRVERIVPQVTSIIQKTKHIRHFGANALELCYVADGTTDAFIDIRGKLRTTDMAAAWLIIREAGAIITKPDGKPLDVRLDPKERVEFVASGNHEMHKAILSLMKPRKEIR
jgi:myo-inositol-1(or 4)-monophosphatase